MKVAIYTRISRDGEGAGVGVKRQEEDCRAYCDKRGWSDITVFTDNNITGMGSKKRPDYEAMLARVKAGEFGAIVTWHLDRMTRSPKDLEHLIDLVGDESNLKVEIRSLNGGVVDLATPEGRLNVRIMANISRYYVEHNRVNNRRAMKASRETGERHGGKPPYGWQRTGKKQIAPVPAEVPHVRKCFEMCIAGSKYAEIAEYMNANGQVTRAGKPFTIQAVMRLVAQATHAGLIEYHEKRDSHYYGKEMGEVYEAEWEGIVSREMWETARNRTADPTRWNRDFVARKSSPALLSRIMKCGVCGENTRHDKGGSRRVPAYICRLGHASVNVTKADDYVVPAILAIIKKSRDAKALSRAMADLERIEAKLAETAEMYRADEISRTQMHTISRGLRESRDAMLNKIRVINLPSNVGTREWWDGLSLDEKRDAIKGTATITLARAIGATLAVDQRITLTPL